MKSKLTHGFYQKEKQKEQEKRPGGGLLFGLNKIQHLIQHF